LTIPRFKYWTIVMDNVPTAFRATDAGELLPTLRQLQRRHPDAVMKWFERGRLWDSPEAARARPPAKRFRPRGDKPLARTHRPFSPEGRPRRGGPRKPRRRD
jgi:hypothetical protein